MKGQVRARERGQNAGHTLNCANTKTVFEKAIGNISRDCAALTQSFCNFEQHTEAQSHTGGWQICIHYHGNRVVAKRERSWDHDLGRPAGLLLLPVLMMNSHSVISSLHTHQRPASQHGAGIRLRHAIIIHPTGSLQGSSQHKAPHKWNILWCWKMCIRN